MHTYIVHSSQIQTNIPCTVLVLWHTFTYMYMYFLKLFLEEKYIMKTYCLIKNVGLMVILYKFFFFAAVTSVH